MRLVDDHHCYFVFLAMIHVVGVGHGGGHPPCGWLVIVSCYRLRADLVRAP